MAHNYDWRLAAEFYALALTLVGTWQRDQIAARLADCRRRCAAGPRDNSIDAEEPRRDEEPAVDALRLPEVWMQLGNRHGSAAYFLRAAHAAEVINDHALAEWARHKAGVT